MHELGGVIPFRRQPAVPESPFAGHRDEFAVLRAGFYHLGFDARTSNQQFHQPLAADAFQHELALGVGFHWRNYGSELRGIHSLWRSAAGGVEVGLGFLRCFLPSIQTAVFAVIDAHHLHRRAGNRSAFGIQHLAVDRLVVNGQSDDRFRVRESFFHPLLTRGIQQLDGFARCFKEQRRLFTKTEPVGRRGDRAVPITRPHARRQVGGLGTKFKPAVGIGDRLRLKLHLRYVGINPTHKIQLRSRHGFSIGTHHLSAVVERNFRRLVRGLFGFGWRMIWILRDRALCGPRLGSLGFQSDHSHCRDQDARQAETMMPACGGRDRGSVFDRAGTARAVRGLWSPPPSPPPRASPTAGNFARWRPIVGRSPPAVRPSSTRNHRRRVPAPDAAVSARTTPTGETNTAHRPSGPITETRHRSALMWANSCSNTNRFRSPVQSRQDSGTSTTGRTRPQGHRDQRTLGFQQSHPAFQVQIPAECLQQPKRLAIRHPRRGTAPIAGYESGSPRAATWRPRSRTPKPTAARPANPTAPRRDQSGELATLSIPRPPLERPVPAWAPKSKGLVPIGCLPSAEQLRAALPEDFPRLDP